MLSQCLANPLTNQLTQATAKYILKCGDEHKRGGTEVTADGIQAGPRTEQQLSLARSSHKIGR